MMYGDDPDPYEHPDRGRRTRKPRRRSSPSLIDALDERPSHGRRAERSRTNWPPPATRYYDDDDFYSAPRPTRINLDDEAWPAPGRYGQRVQTRAWTAALSPSESRGKRASAPVAARPRPRPSPEARPAAERRPAPSRYADDDLIDKHAYTSESDALSVFAHIDTESDSGSSGNRDNFDDDDKDDDDPFGDVESVQAAPAKRAPKSQPPPKKADKARRKQNRAVPAAIPEPNAGSGSSFTMGSSEASVEIVARPPPGPEVDAADAGAVSALLWAVDRLDRFNLALTVVLALAVVAALIGAVLAARPTLYVVSGAYGLLWALMHREVRALLAQVRGVHDLHAAMDAVQLAAADIVTVARRTMAAAGSKLVQIVQVSAGGSLLFDILVAGLAAWTADWIAVGLVAVFGAVSGAAAALAPVQFGAALAAADRIIAEAR